MALEAHTILQRCQENSRKDSSARRWTIVLLDPTSGAGTRSFHTVIFRRPDFFFLQTSIESSDIDVAMIGHAPMNGPSRFKISMHLVEVNNVPLSVISLTLA